MMMYPTTITFGRQQIGDLTGISDDVLGYWMREGLLRPTPGKGGKGQHRRFDYRQVHIAALLGEMRGIGVNIGVLKSIAAVLQRGIEIADSGPWSRIWLRCAYNVKTSVDQFRLGEAPRGYDTSTKRPRPAESEKEICLEELRSAEIDAREAERMAQFIAGSNEYDNNSIRCYCDITREENLLERGVEGRAGEWDEDMWLVSADKTGNWTIRDPENDRTKASGVRCGVTLAYSLIIRRIWIPEPSAMSK